MNITLSLKNWKTTLSGILTTIVALSAAGFFAPNPFINTKFSGYLLAISGMANVLLHVMMNDAPPSPPPATPPTPPTPPVTKP